MFNARLYDFQKTHEENLLRAFANHREVVLSAPTGSGKTVMVCKFIDDYLDEHPDTVFLWLCPGAGGLQKQSESSFAEKTSGIPYGDVYSFISEPDPRGHVFFINWEKINRVSNVVLREGEHKDLMSRVWACHNSNIDIFMIIDEEQNFSETATNYINSMNAKYVLRVSATPINVGDHKEVITDDEVISAGLITTAISINEGLSLAIQENNNYDDDILLLELAAEKRKAIKEQYEKLGLKLNPLVVIQFPNCSEDWIQRIKDKLDEMGYTEDSGLVTSWFTGDHPDNPEEIKKYDGQYAFLLFKQAIATGWDCPRAKILIKLREGTNHDFNVQTIGRIRRMPFREHYDIDLLDNCYLYTLDDTFTEGLTNSISDSFYTYQYKRKTTAPNITLPKESLNGSDRFAVNPEAVVKVVREAMLKECDLDKNGRLDKHEMKVSKGYVFGTILKTTAFEGVARTTHDMMSLNTIFGGEHEINNHDDGFVIRDAKRRIARAIGVDENISNNALRILFGPEDIQMSLSSEEEKAFEHDHKLLLDMSLREYNAFLVNNRDRLMAVFSEISESELGDIKETDVITSEWHIPPYQYYKQHKRIESTKLMGKNIFENYGNNILIAPNRTVTEVAFEEWCEKYGAVEYLYKNGDKGEDFFSVIYRKAFRRNNFYPDYIIQLQNGDVWVIEAKGGMTTDGSSNNIDKYADKKFEALKVYAERVGGFKWGFVRAVGTQLYMSNTVWEENVTDSRVWKPIEEFI